MLAQEVGAIEQCFPTSKPRPMTRYEFAVAVARFLQNLLPQEQSSRSGSTRSTITFAEEFFKRNPHALPALKRLAQQFRPEIEMLISSDAHISKAYRDLIAGRFMVSEQKPSKTGLSTAPPFKDVPRGHWAFAAVEKLRQSGIVIGYPDGAFVR